MENKFDEIQDIDFKIFDNISNALNSIKNDQDINSNITGLIEQVIQINNSLKQFFSFSVSTTKTFQDSVAVMKEHQEILQIMTEKIQDLYSLINGINGSASSLPNLNQSDISLPGVSEIVDIHSQRLDLIDQFQDMHEKELHSLRELIQRHFR